MINWMTVQQMELNRICRWKSPGKTWRESRTHTEMWGPWRSHHVYWMPNWGIIACVCCLINAWVNEWMCGLMFSFTTLFPCPLPIIIFNSRMPQWLFFDKASLSCCLLLVHVTLTCQAHYTTSCVLLHWRVAIVSAAFPVALKLSSEWTTQTKAYQECIPLFCICDEQTTQKLSDLGS